MASRLTRRIRKAYRRKAVRRRVIRYTIVGANLIVVIAVLALVLFWQSGGDTETTSMSANPASGETSPLDTLSSSEIAATAAQLTSLPEATAIENQADSDKAQLSMVASNNEIISKPQVVSTNYVSNKDIKTYVAKKGDTLASVAKKFGVNQDTLRWSNNLSSNAIKKGQKILVPPIDGIVYKVKSGDTPGSLATKYSSDKTKIIAYNDAEIKGLKKGERIIIPGGSKPTPAPSRATYASYSSNNSREGYAWGSSAVYGRNGYDYGYCTWYVANQVSMPANWGNASTWAYYAGRTPGWNVSPTPTVGSIAQRSWGAGGAGHVAIVRAVKGNKVKVSDMNGIAGWGRTGTAWLSMSQFQNYISR